MVPARYHGLVLTSVGTPGVSSLADQAPSEWRGREGHFVLAAKTMSCVVCRWRDALVVGLVSRRRYPSGSLGGSNIVQSCSRDERLSDWQTIDDGAWGNLIRPGKMR